MRILDPAEIVRLTGKKTAPAQARVLRALGIDFRQRPDGAIIVVDADLPVRQEARIPEFTINTTSAA